MSPPATRRSTRIGASAPDHQEEGILAVVDVPRGVANRKSRTKKASPKKTGAAHSKLRTKTTSSTSTAATPIVLAGDAPHPAITCGVEISVPPDEFSLARKSPPERLLNRSAEYDAVSATVPPHHETIAAASSTAAYREQYGSSPYHHPGESGDDLSTLDKEGGGGSVGEEYGEDGEDGDDSGRYFSPVDIDDDDYVDIDSESEDDMRSSFPRDTNSNARRTLIVGGPAPRDTTGLTASEKAAIEREDKVIRKKWTDAQRWRRLKKNTIGSPPRNFMGHCGDTLRPLEEVEKYRLCVGQMFPDKNIFWMRIAEEALLRGITVRAVRSEYTHLTVCGSRFHAEVTFREGLGWTCKVAVCRDGDDTSNIPASSRHDNTNAPLKTPLYYKWVVPIIR